MVKVKIVNGKWVELPEHSTEGMYIDGYLKQNLDLAREHVKKDWDMVFLIDGLEGAGKSVLGMQICKYLDPTFDQSRISYNPITFKDSLEKTETKYQAFLYDEAQSGLSSRRAGSYINHVLNTMFSKIRRKNLFIVIAIPCFFELDKYPAVWRGRALLHVYTGKNYQRGFFEVYTKDNKTILYMSGKRFYDYSKVQPNFRGKFTNHYPIDEATYRKKKDELSVAQDVLNTKPKHQNQRDSLLRVLYDDKIMNHEQIASAVNRHCKDSIKGNTVGDIIRKMKTQEKEIAIMRGGNNGEN